MGDPCVRNGPLKDWLGRQDSNLGMSVPKTDALPLGDAPTAGLVPAARGLIGRGGRKLNAMITPGHD